MPSPSRRRPNPLKSNDRAVRTHHRVVLVGDPERVNTVAAFFDTKECEVASREFHTITGTYKGKRITALSHGIGTDNIDIVLNELDALANIDFATRTIRPTFRQLTLVRIGTSGGLQPFTPIGTYVAAEKSIGFDGVLYFYADSERVRDIAFEADTTMREAIAKPITTPTKPTQIQ